MPEPIWSIKNVTKAVKPAESLLLLIPAATSDRVRPDEPAQGLDLGHKQPTQIRRKQKKKSSVINILTF